MDEKNTLRFQEFQEACQPAIEFLRKNYNPMCKIIISDGFCEIVSSELGYPNHIED